MDKENKMQISRPFGPSIAKVVMPDDLINIINDYVEKIIADEKKSKDQDNGERLAGNVTQEFRLETNFLKSSGFLNFLGISTANWLKFSGLPQIKKFEVISSWVVRQFQNEYNPIHSHSGHISGVGYLKVPSNLGETTQKSKKINFNGNLELIHGSKMFLCNSTFNITPKVGDFYFFPNYMMHSVYPFSNSNDERRSISFNAKIDDEIYNVYGDYK